MTAIHCTTTWTSPVAAGSAASSCKGDLLNALVAEDLPGPGSVFLQVNWRFLARVRPGDVITALGTGHGDD